MAGILEHAQASMSEGEGVKRFLSMAAGSTTHESSEAEAWPVFSLELM